MNNSRFHVIEGGLSKGQKPVHMEENIALADGRIISGRLLSLESAWITNTRLMGVTVMGLTFRCTEQPNVPLLQEWYYFDAAYYGFDRFEYCLGEIDNEWEEIENSFIGGLGGEKRTITRREAAWILARYVRKTEKLGLPPQPDTAYYQFLVEEAEELSVEEQEVLWQKACKKANSDFERVNYYLIRLCDKDYDGVRYVTRDRRLFGETIEEIGASELPERGLEHGAWDVTAKELAAEVPQTTLFQSDLELEYDEAISARIIAGDDETGGFWLYMVRVRLEDGFVAEAQVQSGMAISGKEAMMNAAHPEYLLWFRFDGFPEEFDRRTSSFLKRAMIMEEEAGYLFMIYYEDNSHVDQKHYRIYNDLRGNVFVTETGDVLLSSTSISGLDSIKQDLMQSMVGPRLMPMGFYQFDMPMLRIFIANGMSDFREFMEAIGTDLLRQ